MKYVSAIPGLLVLGLRLALVSPRSWALDWIAVLSLLWIAVVLTPETSRARRLSLTLSCAWLVAIYAVHQGPLTLAGWH